MDSIVCVDPLRCRVWHLHDRLEEHITTESCKEEIESFMENGQLVPALGRPLRDDDNHDIEIICGARRLFIARHTRSPLMVEVRDMTDRDAIIAMDVENRQREDISPYERGRSFATYLRCGLFESQEDIARALSISPSVVSRLLKLARLPSVVVDAFDSAVNIREVWGVKLADVLEDPVSRQPAIKAARMIASSASRPPARDVYRRLLASSAPAERGRPPKQESRVKVVKAENGSPLFRIKHQQDSIALVLPLQSTSPTTLDEIEHAVARILSGSGRSTLSVNLEERRKLHRASAQLDDSPMALQQ